MVVLEETLYLGWATRVSESPVLGLTDEQYPAVVEHRHPDVFLGGCEARIAGEEGADVL